MKLALAKKQVPLRIVEIDGNPETVARLRELGILQQTEVAIVRKSPLSGPVILRVGTAFIVIRSGDANNIVVEEIQ